VPASLCGHAGIAERTIDNSAAYGAECLKRLRGEKDLVIHAAAQAQRAADFILGRTFEESDATHDVIAENRPTPDSLPFAHFRKRTVVILEPGDARAMRLERTRTMYRVSLPTGFRQLIDGHGSAKPQRKASVQARTTFHAELGGNRQERRRWLIVGLAMFSRLQ
jgi:hypothetical protein